MSITLVRDKIVYFVKSPSEKESRISFSIMKRTTKPNGDKSYETITTERITAFNREMKSGVLDQTTVGMEIRRICDELNKEEEKRSKGVWVASDGNLKLLNEYWDLEYADRKIRRPKTARHTLEWAIDKIGPAPLLGDRKELQKVVDNRAEGNKRRQRKLCSVLNQMRKFFGVKERLRQEKKSRPKFLYVTEDEFVQILPFIEGYKNAPAEHLKAFLASIFYTGTRVGEAFAFKRHHYRDGDLKVLTQIDRYEEAE